MRAYKADMSTSNTLGSLYRLDKAIDEEAENVNSVKILDTLIDFLTSHPWDFSIESNAEHKTRFVEKLAEHRRRLQILVPKLSLCLGKLRSIKESVRFPIFATLYLY